MFSPCMNALSKVSYSWTNTRACAGNSFWLRAYQVYSTVHVARFASLRCYLLSKYGAIYRGVESVFRFTVGIFWFCSVGVLSLRALRPGYGQGGNLARLLGCCAEVK